MSLFDDVRFAARALRRNPGLAVAATLTLSLGITANAVMFGVVDQLLLQPPAGLHEPESLRRVYYDFHAEGRAPTATTTYPVVGALERGLEGAEVAAVDQPNELTLGRGAEARAIQVQPVSGNYLRLLGVQPALGRSFSAEEARLPVGERVAVVSDGFWRSELGSREDLSGTTLLINGQSFAVIGVAPPGFSGIDRTQVDAWVPMSSMAAQLYGARWHDRANAWWVEAIARMHPSVSEEVVGARATSILRATLAQVGRGEDSTASVVFGSIIGTRTPGGVSAESKVALWLLGVSAVVLLIACANVANLLVARTIQRRQEISVRLALGVTRGRLARLLLAEAGLIALAGAAAALLLSLVASRFVQGVLLPAIVWNDSVLNLRVFTVTLGAVIVSIVLAGIAPALHGTSTPVADALKSSATQSVGEAGVMRHVLLGLQAALSLVLLVGAGLFSRSLNNVVTRDVGIDMDHAMLVTASLVDVGYSRADMEDVFTRAHERLRSAPGVAGATIVRQSIPTMSGSAMWVVPEGMDEPPEGSPTPYYFVVASDFFSTIGSRIIRGRPFTEAEDRGPARTVIINTVLAGALWPGQDPIGRCAKLGSDSLCSEVVGIVGSGLLFRLVRDDRALVYVPAGHAAFGNQPPRALIVRASGEPEALVATVRREVQALRATMPYVTVMPFSERFAPELRPWRLGATMFTVFGILALVVAGIGLYSVLAYAISQRTREIGLRMALGAQRWDVVRLVARQSSGAVVAGLLVGVGAALLASRWVEPMLYETSPRDPVIYGTAALVLAAAALVASVLPTRRSTRVDPAIALRAE